MPSIIERYLKRVATSYEQSKAIVKDLEESKPTWSPWTKGSHFKAVFEPYRFGPIQDVSHEPGLLISHHQRRLTQDEARDFACWILGITHGHAKIMTVPTKRGPADQAGTEFQEIKLRAAD